MRFFGKNTFWTRLFSSGVLLASLVFASASVSEAGIRLIALKPVPTTPIVAPESAALKFLNQYPELTIAFTDAPGNGHFAATRLVMDRIRGLGYQGKFNIYIDQKIRGKIYHFLPGYDPKGELNQTLKAMNAETFNLELKRYADYAALVIEVDPVFTPKQVRTRSVKRLAIIGGDDYGLSPASVNSDALLVVQPTGWTQSELRITKAGLETTGEYYSVPFQEESYLRLHDAVPHPANPVEFMKTHMQGLEALEKKSAGLQELAKVIDHHEVLTAYGISFQEGPRKFATVLGAISEMQEAATVPLKEGVVVPMISNFNEEEWKKFNLLLNPKYRSKVKVVSVTDANLAESLKAVAKDEILVIKTGTVTQDVWNYLMSKSTFPPMVSGTTGSMYVAKLGKPFFSTAGKMAGTGKESRLHTNSMFQALGNEKVEDVARFMTTARDPHSQISKDFQAYANWAKLGKEKVEGLLDKVTTDTCFIKILKGTVPEAAESLQARKEIEPLVQTLIGP